MSPRQLSRPGSASTARLGLRTTLCLQELVASDSKGRMETSEEPRMFDSVAVVGCVRPVMPCFTKHWLSFVLECIGGFGRTDAPSAPSRDTP